MSYRTLDLYLVAISYRDMLGENEWEKTIKRLSANPKWDGSSPPMPERRHAKTHVCVWPGFAGDPLKAAGDLAVKSIIGEGSCADIFRDWMPVVESIERVGSCQVLFAEETP